MQIKLWIHEKLHSAAVYLFGAKTFFRYQCLCGASILKTMPKPMRGGAFSQGGSFDISPSHGTVVRIDCDFCQRIYELVWNQQKEHFTIAADFSDFLPKESVHNVRDVDGKIIAKGVSIQSARKYQQAYAGSTIEQG